MQNIYYIHIIRNGQKAMQVGHPAIMDTLLASTDTQLLWTSRYYTQKLHPRPKLVTKNCMESTPTLTDCC